MRFNMGDLTDPQKFPGLTQDTLQSATSAVGGAVPPDVLRDTRERGYHYTVFILVDWSLATTT